MNRQLLEMMRTDMKTTKMKGNYNTWVLICPFHVDHARPEHQSLFIDVRHDHFNCIKCGKKGKLDDLDAELEKKQLHDANRY